MNHSLTRSPQVSVIIPTYNRVQQTTVAIESVLAQGFVDYEVLVVDDGSDILQDIRLVARSFESEKRIRFITQEHAGVSVARNKGMQEARGDYFAFLDSDDRWTSEKLEVQMNYIRENTSCVFCHSDEMWWRKGVRVNPRTIHRKACGASAFVDSLPFCRISPSSVLMSRRVYEACGEFDPLLKVCEDYDYWLRVALRFAIDYIPKQLVHKFGGNSDQLSITEPAMDRYRIYSLVQLLTEPALSLLQRGLVTAEIKRKLDILLTGAEKRRNRELQELCHLMIACEDDVLTLQRVTKKLLEPTIVERSAIAENLLTPEDL